jgi:hypothetical protein
MRTEFDMGKESKSLCLELKLGSHAACIWSNLRNYDTECGEAGSVRAAFVRAVRLAPHNSNPDFHLAEMSLTSNDGGSALKYLNRQQRKEQATIIAKVLHPEAFYCSNRQAEAHGILSKFEEEFGHDARTSFLVAMPSVGGEAARIIRECLQISLSIKRASSSVPFGKSASSSREP